MKKTASGFAVYKRLLKVARPWLFCFIVGLVCTMATSGVDSGFAYFIKPIIDKGFIARDHTFLFWLPIIMVIAFLFRSVTNFASTYCVTRVARSVVMVLRQRLFHHFLRMPASRFDQSMTGQLLAVIIYNVDQVAEAASRAIVVFLRESALLIGMIVVMFSLSWELSLVLILVSPLMIWLTKSCSRRMRRLSHGVQESIGKVTQLAEEGISLYKVIRLSGMQQQENEQFIDATRRNRWKELKIVVVNQINSSSVQLLTAIPAIGFLTLATTSWFHITAGGFAAILTAMFGILRPARQLSNLNATFQKGIAGAESVFLHLDQALESDTGTFVPSSRVKGDIVFDQVKFQYRSAEALTIDDVSFTVKPGEMVAFVGKSGGGKSTIMNLLPRFYSIQSGDIRLDGVSINDYTLAALRQQIAFVSQMPTLFHTTIRDNITYGCDKFTEDDLMAAVKAAHADEFIQALPCGFDTVVGDNGVTLSGGQRQRLAIAHAIMKQAPILILDEATSALDTESERHIQAALDELMKTRTTLVIAHRLSTIEHADKILVVDQGCVIETGTHAELLAQQGNYAELYRLQFGGQE